VEASDDRENISDLSAVGAGAGVALGGAAAGFPLPVLRYVVGGGDNTANATTANSFESMSPRDGATIPTGVPIDFAWAAGFKLLDNRGGLPVRAIANRFKSAVP
jgi:hypothetical protein